MECNYNDPIPEGLRTIVEMALSEARRQMDATGTLEPIFMARLPDGILTRADLPGELGAMMNSGHGKDLLFGVLRMFVAKTGATAFVSVIDTWLGIPTEKQRTMPRAELEAFTRSATLDDYERAGLVRRVEALTVLAQTPTDVVIVSQRYDRVLGATVRFGERSVQCVPQENYTGRTKMFGVKPGEDPGRNAPDFLRKPR